MQVKTFLQSIKDGGNDLAIVSDDGAVTYADLYEKIMLDCQRLEMNCIVGTSVLLVDNYSVSSISMLFALWACANVVALTSSKSDDQVESLAIAAGVRFVIRESASKEREIDERQPEKIPPNVMRLLSRNEAGFIVFSSGSTGPSKGVVHRVYPFLERYTVAEKCGAMLAFLLFDHIGGLVTVFQALATHGTLVIPSERSPNEVGRCIEHFNVKTLHVSPTLLNLALISGVFQRWNIQSLQRIYYGSEPVSNEVLKRVEKGMPGIELRQLYGMSEIGVLPCKSKTSDSSWMRVDDPDYSVKVIDGIFHVRGKTNMVGYLYDEIALPIDEYFNTEDLAEEDDGYFKIKGRTADLINVGGSNVCPSDVERILERLENVIDVVVYGETNPILGEVVAARFVLSQPESLEDFKSRIYKEVKSALSPEQIPRLISISEKPLYTNRFKRVRKVSDTAVSGK